MAHSAILTGSTRSAVKRTSSASWRSGVISASSLKEYEAAGLRSAYDQEYTQLVQPHDEFGYLRKRGVSVSFDSKENFDTNYQSNWYYYYK